MSPLRSAVERIGDSPPTEQDAHVVTIDEAVQVEIADGELAAVESAVAVRVLRAVGDLGAVRNGVRVAVNAHQRGGQWDVRTERLLSDLADFRDDGFGDFRNPNLGRLDLLFDDWK